VTAQIRMPSYDGRGLLNLAAELELRLTGRSPSRGLEAGLAAEIPEAESYVLLVIDGLGDHQLGHHAAEPMAEARRAAIDAPFPTTTTASLSCLVTAAVPSAHGVIGHLLWLPEIGSVVNTLRWVTIEGRPVDFDTAAMLPTPNLWERLRSAGREPVTVQPGGFLGSPLSRMLYRGCRFEPVWDTVDLVEATIQLAAVPGRLVTTYLPHLDVAAHVTGQRSEEYAAAMELASQIWRQLAERLPAHVALIGTADHGHIDYPEHAKRLLRGPDIQGLRFWGDPRGVLTSGPPEALDRFGRWLGSQPVDGDKLDELWGSGSPHPALGERTPDALFLAADGEVLLPPGFDKRLMGYHGGLDPAEIEVPLLVR
jgi:hypothetical protein